MNLTKILAGLLVVVAIGLAIMAWMLGRQTQRPVATVPASSIAQTESSSTRQAPVHGAVVAARPVAAGQRLEAEDLKTVQLSAPVVDGIQSVDAAVGRTTLTAIAAEAPLLEQNLVSGLSLQLEAGQRAVSIAVKEPMAAGNHVRPGDFVDVFFTLDGRQGADNASVDTQTRLLLARSRVLAYGTASVENPPLTLAQRRRAQQEEESGSNSATGSMRRGSSGGNGDRSQAQPANTAVLAVPLDDVERLTLAEKYGQLTLALRHPDDTSMPDASLFAALPTVLQPAAGRLPKGEQLQGVDRSFAGLRFKDLATGADARNTRRPAPVLNATRTPQAPRQQTVEFHQGAAVQTVSY